MRRSNGSGCVSKLSGNRRRPWMARVTVGWKDGNQVYKTIGYYPTKAQAEKAISWDDVMPASEHANITLKELFEQWKETRAYTDLSWQTQNCYNAAYKYMSDYYNKKFRDLRLPQFQRMVDKANIALKSQSTMHNIKTLTGILSNYAKDQDIIMKTYYDQVRLPKTEKKKTIPTFTDTEIKLLFKNDMLPMADTVLILIYTGMRITELLTLTKFNVDLENMLITGGVKTEAGTDRIIPIHPKIQKYIQERYKGASNYLIEYEKEVGSEKRGNKHKEHKKYNYKQYCELYYPLLDSLKIRRLTPHKARHTFFTMMAENCTDKKAMALIGGHTDPNFSIKTYDQPDIDRLRKAIESI